MGVTGNRPHPISDFAPGTLLVEAFRNEAYT